MDVDMLIAGDFDQVVWEAYLDQCILGFIAHVSPFGFPDKTHIPNNDWWNQIYEAAGLPKPDLAWEHTGWGLDWKKIYPDMGISQDASYRYCPAYYNYGLVMGPRSFIELMGETFRDDFETVCRVLKRHVGFASQITNCLVFDRHGMPCRTTSINCNFPLNLPGEEIRALNPDVNGEDSMEDIKIFHYIGGRKNFANQESLKEYLRQEKSDAAESVFQRKLQIVHNKISHAIANG